MSTLSFHATKVFNTLEGGALIVHDAETKRQIDYLKNFGFAVKPVNFGRWRDEWNATSGISSTGVCGSTCASSG